MQVHCLLYMCLLNVGQILSFSPSTKTVWSPDTTYCHIWKALVQLQQNPPPLSNRLLWVVCPPSAVIRIDLAWQ